VPQGGPISPIIFNMVMNGIEKEILEIPRVFPVRFADDIQVSADGPEQLEKVKEIITKFLKPRGLVLNEGKTIMKPIELGFEFLGFQIREYPDKTKLLKSKPKKKRGFNSKTN
jgi:RNA-directed DNA polymerase